MGVVVLFFMCKDTFVCERKHKKAGGFMIIVTNNPMVQEMALPAELDFVEGSYGEVLARVKQLIIEEHMKLLTHPLSGSLKPNETYYKSIFVSDSKAQYIDMESLEYIEAALEVYEKFIKMKATPNWTAKVLQDFAFVDFHLVKSTLMRMGVCQ